LRSRPFVKGRSGNPAGRRPGSRNPSNSRRCGAARSEAKALTRKAVDLALAGDPMSLRLCIERILPPSRERPVKLSLPPIETAADVLAAINAVTSALACGTITPGEAARIAMVVATFARAIDTTKRREFGVDPLQILGLANFYETDDSNTEETEDYDSEEIYDGGAE
jgi:Family of unknown function (DUF5681)